MARRRGFFKRRRASHKAFSHRRRSRGISKTGMGGMLSAALYGAGRAYVSDKIQPLTSKIPLGNVSDNVAMLGVNWAIKRFLGNRVPILAKAADAGMIIEAAMIGSELMQGGLSTGGASSNTALLG